MHLAVSTSLSRVEWFGKGPHECYPDRKFGAWLRRHHVAHASELHVPYIFPGVLFLLEACDSAQVSCARELLHASASTSWSHGRCLMSD